MSMAFAWHSHADTIKVFEIDTGIDSTHKDLTFHLDADDIKKSPDNYIDNHGHGTHIAGLILKDVCDEVKLYSCKFFDPKAKGNDNLKKTVACLKLAVEMKADVVVYAGGGTDYNKDEEDAMKALETANIVAVVAAGNEHSDLVKAPYYPASYGFTNMIVVGNMYKEDLTEATKIACSSNRNMAGMVYEYGTGVRSTLPRNNYGLMTGTSQSTAIMTNKILKFRCKKN